MMKGFGGDPPVLFVIWKLITGLVKSRIIKIGKILLIVLYINYFIYNDFAFGYKM